MSRLPDDPSEPVPQDLDDEEARVYEERTVDALRAGLFPPRGGFVVVDEVEAVGSRPDTKIVFRYHHREEFVGRDPSIVPGPLAEVARLWEFATDDDPWANGLMDPPELLAASIASAFEAAELLLVDPVSLVPIGSPPKIYPRLYSLSPPSSE